MLARSSAEGDVASGVGSGKLLRLVTSRDGSLDGTAAPHFAACASCVAAASSNKALLIVRRTSTPRGRTLARLDNGVIMIMGME